LSADRDYAAALQAYLLLAAKENISDAQRADSLKAAIQLALQLDNTELAAELVERVLLPGFRELEHMRVMGKQRQWTELLGFYGETDFEVFPIIVRGDCYQLRAEALERTGRREPALADYRRALRYTQDRRARGKLEAKLESFDGQ
ncbi:MAG: hypothetical protein ABR497_03605, partial [Kiritimatiellia bacterium]